MVSVNARVDPSVRVETPRVVGSTPVTEVPFLLVLVLMYESNEPILRAVEPDEPAV